VKKFLLLVIVLAVAVVAGLPPVAGKVARDQISASLEQASDNGFIVFGLKDFDSGWMNSSGHIEVRFSDQYIETLSNIATSNPDADNEEIAASVADALDESILLDIELSHGPVMLDDGSFIGWSKAVVRINPQDEELLALKDELGIPYFLEIRTQTGFDGTTAFNANIPAMNYLAEVGDFRFSGFELDGTFDGTNLSTEGGTESFSVYGPGIQMEMTNFSFSSKQTMYPPHLWLGITEGSIESTAMHSVNDPNATGVEMHDIRFSSETSLNESPDQVDLGINYSVASMTGPEIDLSDMKIGVHIRQLDIDSVMHYYELNRDMVLVDPNALEERMPELTALAYKALAKSPSIALDPVSFKWNQDAFEASVRLDINGEKLPSEENWDPLNTMAWSAMTSVTAESRIDENLALEIATETLRQQLLAQSSEANPITPEQAVEMARLQAPAMLEMLTLQGLLTRTETGYAVRASFEDSTLTLNGKPIPLGAGMP
jgi:uncharacterized protein YdgA (DUF945 family)